MDSLFQLLKSIKRSGKYLLALILGCFVMAVDAQDFTSVSETAKALYPDEEYVIWKSTDVYTFAKSPDRQSPITGKQTAERQIVKLKGPNNVVYTQSTNSHSVIRFVSATSYDKDRDRYMRKEIYERSIPYESGGIFHNDYFVNPILIYGSAENNLYQLSYSKIVDDYKFLGYVPLSSHYPTLESEVVIEVPSWMKIRMIERNIESFQIDKSTEATKDGGQLYKFKWRNIPKFETEPYSASARHYLPHILLVFESYDRNGTPEKLMPQTADLYSWYKSLVNQVEEKPAEIQELVDQFKGIPKGIEQVAAVNKWISDNIRYIAFESGIAGFKPDACQKVYNNKYGDCKGMANLCKQVLLALGYDARLAWIGTRREVPYTYDIPSLVVDNHMIAAVKLDGVFLFLDPTETWGKSQEYAFRIQGRPVLIEDGESFLVQVVPESPLESDRINRTCTIDFDPSLKASTYTVEETYYGEPKKSLLHGYNGIISKDREEALTKSLRRNNQGSFQLIGYDGFDNSEDFIKINYAFTTSEGVIDLGDEFYLDLDPSRDLENVKVVEGRKSNWYFDERYNRNTKISFKIPKGYSVDHHPKDVNITSDDFELHITHVVTADYVEIEKRIKIPQGEISKAYSDAWETGVRELNSYYEDRVILKKE